MPRYNHAFDIAFEVVSNHEDGEDVTPAMFREGLLARIRDLDKDNAWSEVMCDSPFDSYEMDEE